MQHISILKEFHDKNEDTYELKDYSGQFENKCVFKIENGFYSKPSKIMQQLSFDLCIKMCEIPNYPKHGEKI